MKLTRSNAQAHASTFPPSANNNAQIRQLGFLSNVNSRPFKTNPISAFSPMPTNFYSHYSVPFISVTPFINHRLYSSPSIGKVDKPGVSDAVASSSGSEADVNNGGELGGEWVDKIKEALQIAVDKVTYTGQKAKEASDELSPHIQQLLETQPYLKNVIVPVGCYLTGTILAWFVLPRILRRIHNYAVQGPASLLYGSLSIEQLPYEKSFWGSMEDPVRYMITFMAFVQM